MGSKQNLCVVGDDDQALYRFRGARSVHFEYPQQFPAGKCKQIKLSTNYRSHPGIVGFYDTYMGDKPWFRGGVNYRYTKRIEARNDNFVNAPSVISAVTPEGDDWHEDVYNLLIHLRDNGKLTDWNQVAFLFRSVKSDKVRALAQALEDMGIPVYSPSKPVFERMEVRYFRYAHMIFPQVMVERKNKREEEETYIFGTTMRAIA